jgi:SagB-type dehydrogenase family enzyme
LIGASADELKLVALPAPQTEGGKPLMQVLKERKTQREFATKELPPQVLSNLLWAAFGINRPESGRRTAPSASNRQEIDIYVATAHGLYVYDARQHALQTIIAEDVRMATSTQDFVRDAPLELVFVADFARMGSGSTENKILYSAADTGFISQNVYLYCASEGLATVVRASVDRQVLSALLKLRPEQRIILAQTVGYPKGPAAGKD